MEVKLIIFSNLQIMGGKNNNGWYKIIMGE